MADEQDARPKVALTCTTMGSLRIETAASLMSVQRDERYEVVFSLTHDRPYSSVLNKLARLLCATADVDWWLHIDNDQAWTGNPLDAIEDGKDLVSFPAPIYRPGNGAVVMSLSAWNLVGDNCEFRVRPADHTGGLERVDVISSGSFLVRLDALRNSGIEAPFNRSYDNDGVALQGCDVEFSRKWREAGLEMWADFRCICHHYNTIDLLRVMGDMAMIQKEAAGGQTKRAEAGAADTPRIVGVDGQPPQNAMSDGSNNPP